MQRKKNGSPSQPGPAPGGITLIQSNERLRYEHGTGAVIYYRRPTAREQRITMRQNMNDNEINMDYIMFGDYQDNLLKLCILGWEYFFVEDGDGNRTAIAYTPELVSGLPSDIYADLLRLMGLVPEMARLEAGKKK